MGDYVEVKDPKKVELANKKIEKLEKVFTDMLDVMYDGRENWIDDENLVETPRRIAKMYVTELFATSCNFKDEPKMTVFKKSSKDNMVALFDIELKSTCSHHFIPFVGKCHIGYIPKDGVVCGISKLVRVVDYFMSKPQIQERLTQEVLEYIVEKLAPQGVIVVMEARHHCMTIRGVKQNNSKMLTSAVHGLFADNTDGCKDEFLKLLENRQQKF